jgi:hypothetical protein
MVYESFEFAAVIVRIENEFCLPASSNIKFNPACLDDRSKASPDILGLIPLYLVLVDLLSRVNFGAKKNNSQGKIPTCKLSQRGRSRVINMKAPKAPNVTNGCNKRTKLRPDLTQSILKKHCPV